MNKKVIAVMVFVIVLIIAGYFLIGNPGNKSVLGNNETITKINSSESLEYDIENCDKQEVDQLRDLCFQDKALIKRNESYCSKITEQNQTELCYLDIAIMKGDIEICQKLKTVEKNTHYLSNICFESLKKKQVK